MLVEARWVSRGLRSAERTHSPAEPWAANLKWRERLLRMTMAGSALRLPPFCRSGRVGSAGQVSERFTSALRSISPLAAASSAELHQAVGSACRSLPRRLLSARTLSLAISLFLSPARVPFADFLWSPNRPPPPPTPALDTPPRRSALIMLTVRNRQTRRLSKL